MSRLRSSLAAGENQFRKPLEEKEAHPKRCRQRQKFLKRSRLKRAGKKMLAWEAVRKVLKIRFQRAGITSCECNLPGCWRDNRLGFLHYDKRRFLTPAELWIVALGCNSCHDVYEKMPRAQMKKEVLKIIASREKQP